MFELIAAVSGYLIGSFPTGVVLSRRKFGIDVREMGSGNIGATNVTRVFGWYAGVLTFLADSLKGFLPLYFLRDAYPGAEWALTLAGIALVFGHCFSLYLGFRGGKGVATSLGVVAVINPWLALACALVYAALLVATKISAIGSLGGMVIAVGYLLIFQPSWPVTTLVGCVSVIVFVRHHTNIRRLWNEWNERRGKK